MPDDEKKQVIGLYFITIITLRVMMMHAAESCYASKEWHTCAP